MTKGHQRIVEAHHRHHHRTPFRLDIPSVLPVIFLIAVFLSSCGEASTGQARAESEMIPLKACQLSSPGLRARLPAQCGKLQVLENPESQDGRMIELNIAVIPAVSRNPAPDPVFFIPGGPGEAATHSYLAIAGAFERIRQKRDIVLVDQRGTGGSNPLTCPALPEAEDLPEEEANQAYLENCLATIDADPRFYTTPYAVKDLEQVRAALGYSQVNVYGASYGTRVALDYLRQHPDRVRAVLLDGVAPPNWILGPEASGDAQRALDLIFSRCAASTACAQAFPDLAGSFQKLLDELDHSPVEVQLNHPVSGEPATLALNRATFANTIHQMSYTPETTALLPLLIHTAAVEGDWDPLAAQSLSSQAQLNGAISAGMRFSVLCAEDVPYYKEENFTQGYLGDLFFDALLEACQTWPVESIAPAYHDAVRSDKPVLILSGEADPVTPPENGELAAGTLPNSLHLVIPGQGHINLYRGCIPVLATQFIEQGSVAGLDTSCVDTIAPVPFFISFSGPQP